MIFRRAKQPFSTTELEDRDRRRKSEPATDPPEHATDAEQSDEPAGLPSGDGPYDSAELGLQPGQSTGVVDVGALLIRPRPGMEVRLQVDEKSQRVVAAILVSGSAGVELRAFAAPRSSGIWDDIRHEVAAETTRRGGVATESTGRFGREVTVAVPTSGADGKTASQTSRIVGVDGPRWFVRATFVGEAATDADTARPLEDALADVVVVRGSGPMAPRELIPMAVPDSAKSTGSEPSAT